MALLQRSRLHLVVDVGTALISGMIWREYTSLPRLTRVKAGAFAKNKKPDILEVMRVPIEGKVRHSLIPTLKVFFQKAEEALGWRDPVTITIGLAAPYYQGKTVWARASFAKPSFISLAMIEKFCEEKKAMEKKALPEGEEFFAHDILAIFFNGYHVEGDPKRKAATQLDIAMRFSAWRSALKKQLNDILEERFPHALVRVSTFPIAYGELFKRLPHFIRNAAVIDIGGSITECSFFDDGILEEVLTIPQGSDLWLSRIAEHEGVSRDEIISWMSGGPPEARLAHPMSGKRFDQEMVGHLAEWNALLRPIIAAKMLTKPARHFFLVGGGALLPQTSASFSSFLQTFQFGSNARSPDAFGRADVHALSAEAFRDRFGQWPSSLLSFLDISLIALALRIYEPR